MSDQHSGETAGATVGVDTRDMITVHDALRREYGQMPGQVRGVADGDRDRVTVVADHVAFVGDLPHHHHQGEDRLLWPVLMPRVPDQRATVEMMERQHEGIREAHERATVALARWRASSSATDRDELADALELVGTRLTEHLAAEESTLLPLASKHLSQDEWNRLGEEGMGGLPKGKLPLVFGMIMYRADPKVISDMLTHIQLVPRVVLPRVAPGIRSRYMSRLYGTADPS